MSSVVQNLSLSSFEIERKINQLTATMNRKVTTKDWIHFIMNFGLNICMTSNQITGKVYCSCSCIMTFEHECIDFFLDVIEWKFFSMHLSNETIKKNKSTSRFLLLRIKCSNTFLNNLFETLLVKLIIWTKRKKPVLFERIHEELGVLHCVSVLSMSD